MKFLKSYFDYSHEGSIQKICEISEIFDRILADQARIKYTEIELAKNGKNPGAIR